VAADGCFRVFRAFRGGRRALAVYRLNGAILDGGNCDSAEIALWRLLAAIDAPSGKTP
jgi:hypothetical protein